ncbi:MAG: AIPR family protein [Haliscomenobacter sp.]|nr:AIPR family protein [Haliscomenobacter sp.]
MNAHEGNIKCTYQGRFYKAKESFESKNPRSQVFKKEDLAKYVNAWQEVFDGKKLVIGPHTVVRGGQKNFVQFVNFNLVRNPDNIYFEDTVAKMILFRSTERIYGVKPNAIGDMRYITVPYSIAWLGFKTENKLDLYKIWKHQSLSEDLKKFLRQIMENVEKFIREKAPGSLYGEWAKRKNVGMR